MALAILRLVFVVETIRVITMTILAVFTMHSLVVVVGTITVH